MVFCILYNTHSIYKLFVYTNLRHPCLISAKLGLNTKVVAAPLQTLDLGDGQITAGANIGAQNVVAVWNGNNSASQTTFYVVSNDLETKFTSSPVSGVFKHCEVYSSRVYCGGSTSAVDLNSDSSKSAIFAVINPSNGQIENQWQLRVENQATELADFLIRSNGRIFAATNGTKCIGSIGGYDDDIGWWSRPADCSRMTEFNTSGNEITNWWMSPAPDGLLVAAIADFEGSIWAGFTCLSTSNMEGYSKYAVFSYNGIHQGVISDVTGAGHSFMTGTLHSMQVANGGIYTAHTYYGDALGFSNSVFVSRIGFFHYSHGVIGSEPFVEASGFFQGIVGNRSILIMTGWRNVLSNPNKIGWITWVYSRFFCIWNRP